MFTQLSVKGFENGTFSWHMEVACVQSGKCVRHPAQYDLQVSQQNNSLPLDCCVELSPLKVMLSS